MIEASIRGEKIHTKCRWTFLAGLRGCSALQRMTASGTEDKRREMGKMGKIPSWRLVNANSGGIKSPKIQSHSPFHFFRIIYFLTSIRICSKQKRKKKDPKENLFFLATTKMIEASIRGEKIHTKCTWTFLAGLLGSSALQRMAASGREDKGREMGKMGNIPSWPLVNAKSGGIKSPKIQSHSPFHFLRIICFLTSIRICSKWKRKKKDPKENLFFLATTKMTSAAIRKAKIHKKYKRTYPSSFFR